MRLGAGPDLFPCYCSPTDFGNGTVAAKLMQGMAKTIQDLGTMLPMVGLARNCGATQDGSNISQVLSTNTPIDLLIEDYCLRS